MTTSSTQAPTVGLVVVTHGSAAVALLEGVAGILGALPAAEAVCISMEERIDGIRERVGQACENVDSGAGVLLLVDLHGSSPYQACMAMLDGSRPAEVVSGVNLPMLMKLTTIDRVEVGPLDMALLLREVGRRSIRIGSELTGKVTIEEVVR